MDNFNDPIVCGVEFSQKTSEAPSTNASETPRELVSMEDGGRKSAVRFKKHFQSRRGSTEKLTKSSRCPMSSRTVMPTSRGREMKDDPPRSGEYSCL